PTNAGALWDFRHHLADLWRRALRRRSQKDATRWQRSVLEARWLPRPRITHPWPNQRFTVRHPRWEPVREFRTPGSVRGVRGNMHPYRERYWEHTLRDADDFARHLDCIHFNPVKHGHAVRVQHWPVSSFRRWVRLGAYPPD